MRRDLIAHHLELSLREALETPRLRLVELAGDRPEIDERREPWIPVKYGPANPDDWFGVVRAVARYERAPGLASESLDLAVKVNPRQGLARTLIPWIIENKGIALDRPYSEFHRAAECDRTGAREQSLYALAKTSPALTRVLPRCYGGCSDNVTGEHALFIQYVADVAHSMRAAPLRTGLRRQSAARCAQPPRGRRNFGISAPTAFRGPARARRQRT